MAMAPDDRAKQLLELGVLAALLPAAQNAEKLHAAGIRIAIDSSTRQALQHLKDQGNQAAATVLESSYPTGHIEVALVN